MKIFHIEHKNYIGCIGVYGSRAANFAVQNSDFILSLGSRLDTKSTGTPINSFARNAYKIVVDIDPSELRKFENFDLKIDKKILGDLTEFFNTSSNISMRRNTDALVLGRFIKGLAATASTKVWDWT